MTAPFDDFGPVPRLTRVIQLGDDKTGPMDCPPHLLDAIRRASQYAAEARARDAARKVREETAREWAWRNAAEMRAGT